MNWIEYEPNTYQNYIRKILDQCYQVAFKNIVFGNFSPSLFSSTILNRLSKIHQKKIPIRPLVSSVKSFSANISWILNNITNFYAYDLPTISRNNSKNTGDTIHKSPWNSIKLRNNWFNNQLLLVILLLFMYMLTNLSNKTLLFSERFIKNPRCSALKLTSELL